MEDMTNINRVLPGVPTGGEFAAHNRADGDATLLTEADRPISLSPLWYAVIHPNQFNGVGGPVDSLDFTVDRKDGMLHASAIRDIDILTIRPDGMSEADWRDKLDRKWFAVKSFFGKNYEASIELIPQFSSLAFVTKVQFDLTPLPIEGPITPAELNRHAVEDSLISGLAAAHDEGTLGQALADHLDTYNKLPSATVGAARDLTPAFVREQVKYRLGENEIDDDVAVAGCHQLARTFDLSQIPAIRELGRTGVFNIEDICNEIGEVYPRLGGFDDDFVSMLGTWALSKRS